MKRPRGKRGIDKEDDRRITNRARGIDKAVKKMSEDDNKIDWDTHSKRRRVWDKLDKASQKTAKTKRNFGPKGNKKSAGTMQVAFRKALEKRNHEQQR